MYHFWMQDAGAGYGARLYLSVSYEYMCEEAHKALKFLSHWNGADKSHVTECGITFKGYEMTQEMGRAFSALLIKKGFIQVPPHPGRIRTSFRTLTINTRLSLSECPDHYYDLSSGASGRVLDISEDGFRLVMEDGLIVQFEVDVAWDTTGNFKLENTVFRRSDLEASADEACCPPDLLF